RRRAWCVPSARRYRPSVEDGAEVVTPAALMAGLCWRPRADYAPHLPVRAARVALPFSTDRRQPPVRHVGETDRRGRLAGSRRLLPVTAVSVPAGRAVPNGPR